MTSRKEKTAWVKKIKKYGEISLHLNFAGSFEKFTNKNPTANWLYAVYHHKLKSVRGDNCPYEFSWDASKLKKKQNSYKRKGYDCYLYRAEAHGGGSCPITPSLLSSTKTRQGYVILHEAWHTTLYLEGIRVPYALEESFGRLVGVVGTLQFARKTKNARFIAEAKKQVEAWEKFSLFVNRSYKRLERLYKKSKSKKSKKDLFTKIEREAEKLKKEIQGTWEAEELNQTMNNAFFFRYYDYTQYYPLALKIYRKKRSLKATMKIFVKSGKAAVLSDLKNAAL